MDITFATSSPLSTSAEVLVIPVFGPAEKDALAKAADSALDGALFAQAEAESFKGKQGQTLLCYTRGALECKAVALVGAGSRKAADPELYRHVGAYSVKSAHRIRAASMAAVLPPISASHLESASQLFAEGLELGAYTFLRYRTGESVKPCSVEKVELHSERSTGKKKPSASAARKVRAAIKHGQAVAAAINNARDMVNEPAAAMTPSQVASIGRRLAKKHTSVTCKVLSAKECEKLGMGMFLGVAQGSEQEPKVVHLTYKPKRAAKKTIAFVGKGVTFDSGGYSLKPTGAMEDMKIDMAGCAAVVSAMDAIATIGSPYEIHVVTACAENMVSGGAYKLGDVLEAMDGTTVEITNTDAEGRLTLGDAIAYIRSKAEPDELFDFATLTGACMVALGHNHAGVMTTDAALCKRWMKAVDAAGELAWELPMHKRYGDSLKSSIADLKNSGERWGGTMIAATFLKHFVKDTPWVHVDIAGPAHTKRTFGAVAKGGTGYAVASIVEYATRG
jgi:leucyl aminopeptidase